jgi:RHS repeat-associated protein
LHIQVSFAYSDGFGREIQKKIPAEPGPVPQRDDGKVIVGADGQPLMTPYDATRRWVGSGWTVLNNKGKPVRQYEPFFTDTHRFEFDLRIGVSPVLFYDPVERVVATLHPNHTWEKVVFDPWRQENWDVNDTVSVADPRTDADVGDFFSRLPSADYSPSWYALRTEAANASAFAARYPDATDQANETRAAEKTCVHGETPTITYADSLGRTFLTVAQNRFELDGTIEEYPTRIELDIEGNQRAVRDSLVQAGDALGRIVMRYDYDMLGNRIYQTSMEAGERWMLNDVAGKPLYAWDSRDHRLRIAYDELRRPTDSLLSEGGGAEMLVGRTSYGESRSNPEASNLRGKVVELRDQAGVVTNDLYDFKGNLLESRRQLADLVDSRGSQTPAYRTTVNWYRTVQLAVETYLSRTRYDALNRPTQMIAPRSDQSGTTINVIQPVYNEANLLEQVHAWFDQTAEPSGWLDPATANLHAVTDIDYDAKGQRTRIDQGTQNGSVIRTSYVYDSETFRLTHLYTRRGVDPSEGQGVAFTDDCANPHSPPPTIAAPEVPPQGQSCGLQNLHYTYDPAGNITHIRDDAQQTIYFRNIRVEPSADYTYDAIYRLIEATGREHLGQAGGAPIPHSYNDSPRVGVLSGNPAGRFSPNDGSAMGRYCEQYVYDAVGNIMEMIHRVACQGGVSWRRTYTYSETSQLEPGNPLEPGKQSNRLTSTTVGGTTEIYSTDGDGYDAHGNMLRMPHLQVMQWDFQDQLQMTQRQRVNDEDADGVEHHGERTWYVYDATGQRVRKVTELATGEIKDQRIYLGGFEIYRRNGASPLVRETLHIMDDKQRIALVETRTQGSEPGVPRQLIRYQFSNHLGSASLELDDQGQIISYEEYTPYGSTAYQAVRSQTETPKRYRYTGKERDEETGLNYHGARYCTPWLGRWISCDPAGLVDGMNLYRFVNNNPIIRIDTTGRNGCDPKTQSCAPTLLDEVLNEEYQSITEERQQSIAIEDMPVLTGEGRAVRGRETQTRTTTQVADLSPTILEEVLEMSIPEEHSANTTSDAQPASTMLEEILEMSIPEEHFAGTTLDAESTPTLFEELLEMSIPEEHNDPRHERMAARMMYIFGLPEDRARQLAPHLNEALFEFGITDPDSIAFFLAQTGVETGGYRAFRERGSAANLAARYGNRPHIMGAAPGGYPEFLGRGAIQLTGLGNYQASSARLGLDLVANPGLAELDENAFRVAAEYWTRAGAGLTLDQRGGLSQGSVAQYDIVSLGINPGIAGNAAKLAHRRTYLNRALATR